MAVEDVDDTNKYVSGPPPIDFNADQADASVISESDYRSALKAAVFETSESVQIVHDLEAEQQLEPVFDQILADLETIRETTRTPEQRDVASDFQDFASKSDIDLSRLASKYVAKLIEGPLSTGELEEIALQVKNIEADNSEIVDDDSMAGAVFRMIKHYTESEQLRQKMPNIPRPEGVTRFAADFAPGRREGFFSQLARNFTEAHKTSKRLSEVKAKYSISKSEIPAMKATSHVAAQTIDLQFSTLFARDGQLDPAVTTTNKGGFESVRTTDPEQAKSLQTVFNKRMEGLFRSYKFCLDNKKLTDHQAIDLARATKASWSTLATNRKIHAVYWPCISARDHLWELKQAAEDECRTRGLDPSAKIETLRFDDDDPPADPGSANAA